MSPAMISRQPLQYFIHYDFDALRMEIAGSLVGRAARKAYETWRAARLIAGRRPLVVDISYVTEVDEDGRAILRSWREHNARIVASPWGSRAIADPILSVPAPEPSAQRALLERLAALFSRPTAGNPASAEIASVASAGAKQNNAENAGFAMRGEMEEQMR